MADEVARPPRVRLPVILDELDRQLDRGAQFHHGMHTEALERLHDLSAVAFAGVELMMQKGLFSKDELRGAVAAVRQQLHEHHWTRTHGYAFNAMQESKYEPHASNMIDCDARMPLCKAVCCHYSHPLQQEDIQEGIVKWDLGRPYWIRKDDEGRCVHHEKDTGRCGVFEHRPLICRMYSCKNDKRVWLDFEQRIPNTAEIERALAQKDDRKMMMEEVHVQRTERED